MVTRRDSIWKSLDWVTICVYLILIAFGWFSVCGASYDYGDRDFWDPLVQVSNWFGSFALSDWGLCC